MVIVSPQPRSVEVSMHRPSDTDALAIDIIGTNMT